MTPKFPNLHQQKQWELTHNSLPDDVALNIASFLQPSDICALGSCSRFWRDLCSSDFLWISLSKQRWPSLDLSKVSAGIGSDRRFSLSTKVVGVAILLLLAVEHHKHQNMGWRNFYINWHQEMADRVAAIVQYVKQCSRDDSLEVGDYLKAIGDLCSMELGFKDVQLFLFSRKQNVLLNLIGLHYSLFWLGVTAEDVRQALFNCQISERQVCVRWWKLGRWFHGFRLRDESRLRRASLSELAMAKDEEIMGVLNRGAIHEVLRIQIFMDHPSTTWAYIHS